MDIVLREEKRVGAEQQAVAADRETNAGAPQVRHFIMRLRRAGWRSARPLNCGVRRRMPCAALLSADVALCGCFARAIAAIRPRHTRALDGGGDCRFTTALGARARPASLRAATATQVRGLNAFMWPR